MIPRSELPLLILKASEIVRALCNEHRAAPSVTHRAFFSNKWQFPKQGDPNIDPNIL